MTVIIMEMPSYTFALKGEKLLKARGISCELKRNINASPSGCSYSLYIRNDGKKAASILQANAVPFTIKDKGGG